MKNLADGRGGPWQRGALSHGINGTMVNPVLGEHAIIPRGSAAMPILFLLSIVQNIGFTPRRGDTLPDKREIWHGRAPNFTFIWAEMWEYSPQNCQNFEFWP